MKVRIKNFNGELPEYLTEGKEYDFDINGFGNGAIDDDNGDWQYIRINDCAHLNGGDWEIVE